MTYIQRAQCGLTDRIVYIEKPDAAGPDSFILVREDRFWDADKQEWSVQNRTSIFLNAAELMMIAEMAALWCPEEEKIEQINNLLVGGI